MTADQPEETQEDRAIARRRRLFAVLAGVVILVVALVGLLGSGDNPKYVPPGGAARTLSTGSSKLNVSRSAPFHPAPVAQSRQARMPLGAQVAQLFLVRVGGTAPAGAGQLGSIPWGGVVLSNANYAGVGALRRLVGAVRAQLTRAGTLAPLIGAAQEGGPQSAFPDLPPQGQAAVGARHDPARATNQALLAARRLGQLGISLTLAPLADVDSPTGPLTGRLFGSDPGVVTQMTRAELSGYARGRIIAAVGHFPGSGGASADPDQSTATVGGSLTQLQARDLIPFAAVAAQAPIMVMSNAAYVAFDGVTPASLSSQAVSLLRRKLDYQGVVMTDDLAATLLPSGQSPGAVALQALRAGADLLYISGPPSEREAAYQAVLAAARRDAGVRSQVSQAVVRVLTLQARYGLLR